MVMGGFKKPFVLMTSVPVLVPAGEGVKVTSTLQFDPEGKLVGQSLVSAKRAACEARRAAFGQSVARLQHASRAAVSTLLKVMVDPNAPASSRVRAADSIRTARCC
jgi:hypothetical protein